MFQKSADQSSLFDVETYFQGVLPQDDWSFIYRDQILPLIDEEKFQHLYDAAEGRPNAPLKIMLSLLIFMGMERLTWRGVEFQFSRRLDWLCATRTPVVRNPIDHTTLFKFYQRLEGDETARELFVRLTEHFINACGTSIKKQRTDSFYMHGWLRILSRYGLFKETIRKFLLNLRKQKPGLYEKIKGQLSQNYLEKEFDLTEKDHELAQRKVALMAQDLYRLQTAFSSHKQIAHYESFKILCQVFNQQCQVKESHQGEPEIVIKEKPDKDAICTPHNPEARYTRKGKQRVTGDKAVITETCGQENQTQFLLDVDVHAANHYDGNDQEPVQQRLTANKFKPEQQYCDAGFVNGQTILNSEQNGIALEGPTPGHSQSFESYNNFNRPFDAADFKVNFDPDTRTMTIQSCPLGQISLNQHRSAKTKEMLVHFDPRICGACDQAARCPVKIGKRVATWKVLENEYVSALRYHLYMEDSRYRKQCAIRAGVEATVSEMTRVHGVRKSRHRSRSRTRLQLIFAAMSCNVKRFIRHGQNYGYLSPKMALEVA